MPLALLASLLLTLPGPPDDPAVLQGLDAAGQRMLMPGRERLLQADALVEALKLTGTEHVADVGAGPGFFSLRLARALPKGRVIATDVDPQALAVLDRRAKVAGLSNIETRRVEAAEPGLAPASVDLLFLCQVDHYLVDRVAYFRKLAPALKPGGRLVIANYEKYRAPVQEAAQAVGFTEDRELLRTPGHFAVVFIRAAGR